MKSWINTFFLLSALVLTACGSKLQDSNISCDQQALCKKAVVVLFASAPYRFFYTTNREAPVYTEWERIDPAASDSEKIVYHFREEENYHMVLPGTYKLRAYGYTIGNWDYYVECVANSCITFTAAPGDFIYLGNIIIENSRLKTSIPLLADSYEQAIECVRETLCTVKKPLEKKLIKGLCPGCLQEIMYQLTYPGRCSSPCAAHPTGASPCGKAGLKTPSPALHPSI